MSKRLSALPTRRFFARTAIASSAASVLLGQEAKQITQASVPGDPQAPEPQEGTVPEWQPFDKPLQFTRRDVPRRVEPIPMADVRLLPGEFLSVQEANRRFLHKLSVDRLVHAFRLTAGLPSTAEPLGGWEKPDSELRGHFIGHYLSACALMFASTGDEEIKSKGNAIVVHLAECQQHLPDGYLSAFPIELFDRLNARKKVWAPFYTIHKVMAGLLDMHQYCANQQALAVLKNMAGWVDKWTGAMPETHMQMVLNTEYGGMNEVLYNLAAVTGEPHYAEIGDRFTKQRFFNPLALRRDRLRGLHTNTHIPQVIGAARRYEISGDARFHDVADYFWHAVVETRTYATGGTSNNEGWLVEPNRLAQELKLGSETNECCCAYNMMKLTRMLYRWTADPRYFDYYERALYNHRLGTIDTTTGGTQYYLGVVPGSWRTFGTEYDSFWCCNGTGVEEFSKLNDSIYFQDAEGIYVNLFIPSEVHWTAKGVRLQQTNRFPDLPETNLTITCEKPTRFSLHVRVPAWVAGFPALKINGTAADVSAAAGSYVTILRTWNNGDTVDLHLPMKIYAEAMADDSALQAFFYGPLVLAGEVASNEPVQQDLVVNHMGPNLKKKPLAQQPALKVQDVQLGNKPLTFVAGKQMALVPFHRMPRDKRYSIYWKSV